MDNALVIWVVEDDPSTQRIVAQHLKTHGFSPVLFNTAEKAYMMLQACLPAGREELPALMILDMLLPGMSGVDLIRLIKQNSSWDKIPVVVVTVLSREESLADEPKVAEAYWVNKPFDTNNLIRTVQDVLASVGQEGKQI